MNKDIILIIDSCDLLNEVKNELKKPLSFFRFKDRKECKDLEQAIHNKIKSLADDKWTASYLFNLQHTLKAYKSKLKSYMNNIYISEEDDKDDKSRNSFSTMYFKDTKKDNQIILDVIGDHITFTIFDNDTGNSFSVSSDREVQLSQKKIESVCKERLVEMLEDYCNRSNGSRTM